ncbi:MAG: hypothetical protein AAGF95_11900 [Chloroflexota bacterium]
MPDSPENEALSPGELIALYEAPDPTIDNSFLSGIYDIDWAQLDHAHGEATDVPALLRALLSDTYAHRDFALELLFETVWHQGSIYRASAYAARFLMQLLTYDETPCKEGILYLLSAFAEGYYGHVEQKEDTQENQLQLGSYIDTLNTITDAKLRLERKTQAVVAQGIPLFLELSTHSDPEIVMAALDTLSRLPDYAATITPHLEARLVQKADMPTKANLILALHKLLSQTAEHATVFEQVFQREDNEILQVLAARAVLVRRGVDTPTTMITTLQHASTVIDTIPENSHYTWSLEAHFYPSPMAGDQAVTIAEAFAALGLPTSAHTLMDTLKDITVSRVAYVFVENLLDLVFGGTSGKASARYQGLDKITYTLQEPITPRVRNNLTSLQQDTLRLIADHDPFWEIEHNLLEVYGLPSERSTLREWLDD